MSAVVDSQLWQKLEAAFARFENAWQSGPPVWEEHLEAANNESLDRTTLVREFVKIDLDYRWKQTIAGPNSPLSILSPRPASAFDRLPIRPLLESYVECLPELGAIERISLELIGEEYRVRRRYGDSPRKEEYRARFFGYPPDEIDQTLGFVDRELRGESTDSAATKRRKLGRYELIEQIGQGAFGVVWKAWDPHLRREVAVKLPRGAAWTTPEGERRFVREACATAKLSHDGIVSVHDVGREDDAIFLVAELVQGTTLAEWLKTHRPSVNESIELVARLAEALDYAHRHGIVHRDIKPSNVMLDTKGADFTGTADSVLNSPSAPVGVTEDSRGPSFRLVSLPFRPRIMDFGLAKRTAGDTTMTRDGHLLGTPAYMSPEQFRDPHKVDGRSDVYSLGVVLYELLTGSVPFQGETHTVLAQVQTKPPPSIRKIAGSLPSGAEAIVMKCLAKSPDDRYWTAGELADDLRRLLNSQQTRAQGQGSLVEYIRRMFQLPWAAVVVPLLLLLGSGLGVVASRYFQTPEVTAATNSDVEPPASEQPNPNTFAALDLNNIAETNRFDGMPSDLVAVIGQSNQRHWGQAYQVVCIPRSNLVATSSEGGFVHLWRYDENARRMDAVDSFWASPGRIRGLATLRDGNWLATGGDDGVVRLWDLDRERRLAFDVLRDAIPDREEAPASVVAIAAAAGVDRLAVATERGATVWELGEVPAKRIAHIPGEGMVGISFGQSADEIVIVQADAASLWKLDAGESATSSTPEKPLFVHALKLQEDESEENASEGGNDEAEQGDDENESQPNDDHETEMNEEAPPPSDEGGDDEPSGDELPPTGVTLVARWENHGAAWQTLAVEPTLGLLALGGHDQGPIVWSLKSPPEAPPVHRIPSSGISSLAFFPGRADLIAATGTGALSAWNLGGKEPRPSFQLNAVHAGPIYGLALDPSAHVIFTVGEDHTVRASHSESGQTLTKIEGHVGPISRVLFLGGDSEQIASWSTAEKSLRLWQAASGGMIEAQGIEATVDPLRVAVAPDGSFFALAEEDAGKTSVILRNRDGNRRYAFPKSFMELLELAVSPDGQRVVVVTAAGEILDGNIAEKHATTRRNADEEGNFRAAAISPLADAVAMIRHDGGMQLKTWRADRDADDELFSGDQGDVTMVAFSPDGRWLAAVIDESQLRMWKVEDGSSWKEPYDDSEAIAAMAFSPDSEMLVLALRDGGVRWIDTSTVGSAGSKRGREGPDPVVRFSPDGRHFLIADRYGRVTLWNSSNDRVVRQWEFGGAILDAAFSPDGRHIVTGNANGTAYVLRPSGW